MKLRHIVAVVVVAAVLLLGVLTAPREVFMPHVPAKHFSTP